MGDRIRMTRKERLTDEALAFFADPNRVRLNEGVDIYAAPGWKRGTISLPARYASPSYLGPWNKWAKWATIPSTAASIKWAMGMMPCVMEEWKCSYRDRNGHHSGHMRHQLMPGHVQAPCGCTIRLADWWTHALYPCVNAHARTA